MKDNIKGIGIGMIVLGAIGYLMVLANVVMMALGMSGTEEMFADLERELGADVAKAFAYGSQWVGLILNVIGSAVLIFGGLQMMRMKSWGLCVTACALAMLEAADESGLVIDEPGVRRGLQSVSWEGRLECVQTDPLVLLDGAHNPHAAYALARFLSDYLARHQNARLILVWGMMRDKDHREFIAPLLPIVSDIVLTQATLARSATIHELRNALPPGLNFVHEAMVPAEALSLAIQRATSKDLICVTGSLMLVGDIKAVIRGCRLSPIRG